MAIDRSHTDIALHCEELSTGVFGCDRMEDPCFYVNANDCDAYFIQPGEAARMRLYTITDSSAEAYRRMRFCCSTITH
jgi:hypothetical protein